MNDRASDAALLAQRGAEAGDAYAVFYRRHLPIVLGFTLRRVGGDRELAADVTAEVFAKALVARERFDPAKGDARAWLCTIAARTVLDARRKGRIQDEARRRLGMEPVVLLDPDLERVDELASLAPEVGELEALIGDLSAEHREAVTQRVVDGHSYEEIAATLGTSESVIRKRVSRGLARLRDGLEGAR